MNAVVAQWIGRRDHQEDAYAVRHLPDGTLAIVCDGMGGHDCGDAASRTAAEAFVEHFSTLPADQPVRQRLQASLEAANAAVAALFAENGLFGGTTLAAIFVTRMQLWWVSVGDSPLMLWRQRKLQRLNEDHSMRGFYMEYVRSGLMGPKEAMMQGHVLRSAVTGSQMDRVDLPPRPCILLPKDRVVLATDGVENLLMLPVLAPQTQTVLSSPHLSSAAAIVEACQALNDPVADNTTVIVLDV